MKKVVDSPTDAPGVTEASEGTPTQANTVASEVAESQCSKTMSNREELVNSQIAAKVNQDLFYASAAPPQETIEPEVSETKKKKKKKNKRKDLDA